MIIKFLNSELAKIHNKKIDDTIAIEDKNGVPISQYWRNRIADSKVDKCIQVIKGGKK